jgi:AcrR family transcriptional regulator
VARPAGSLPQTLATAAPSAGRGRLAGRKSTGTRRDRARTTKPQPVRARAQRTRANLLAGAEYVFARDGFLDARVTDISAHAKVSHGTFYTYFNSKEDIFRQTADARVLEITDALKKVDRDGSVAERVCSVNRRWMEVYEQHAAFLGVVEQVATFNEEFRQLRIELRRRFTARIEGAIRRIAEEESPGLDLDPYVAACALGGMTDDFAYAWFVLKEPFDRETALRTIDQIWLRALGLDISTGARVSSRRRR